MFDFDFPSLSNTQYEEDDKGLTFKFNLTDRDWETKIEHTFSVN
jgi:hypothetical protein